MIGVVTYDRSLNSVHRVETFSVELARVEYESQAVTSAQIPQDVFDALRSHLYDERVKTTWSIGETEINHTGPWLTFHRYADRASVTRKPWVSQRFQTFLWGCHIAGVLVDLQKGERS